MKKRKRLIGDEDNTVNNASKTRKEKRNKEEGEEDIEDARTLCLRSKIFTKGVLTTFCDIEELWQLRLVSRRFQSIVLRIMLSRYFVNFKCLLCANLLNSHHTTRFLELNDVIHLNNVQDNPRYDKYFKRMTSLKTVKFDSLCTIRNNKSKILQQLPRTITSLSFPLSFDSLYYRLVPNNVTHLAFGHSFNKPVDHLHEGLISLSFSGKFNQKLNRLPNSVTHLSLKSDFDRSVNHLPLSLVSIEFAFPFNRPLSRLPHRVSSITFAGMRSLFDKNVDVLPDSLRNLRLGQSFNRDVDHLPDKLTHLSFGDCFNRPVDLLPASLTHLSFGVEFNQPVDRLPNSLLYLSMGYNFVQDLSRLPERLECLVANGLFDKPLNNLPRSLKRLTLREKYRNEINGKPLSSFKPLRTATHWFFIGSNANDRADCLVIDPSEIEKGP